MSSLFGYFRLNRKIDACQKQFGVAHFKAKRFERKIIKIVVINYIFMFSSILNGFFLQQALLRLQLKVIFMKYPKQIYVLSAVVFKPIVLATWLKVTTH